MAPKGRKRKKCSHVDKEGTRSTNNVQSGGVCRKHGAKYQKCSHVDKEGKRCTNNAVKGGVCRKHGAKYPKCSHVDKEGKRCTNNALQGGVCAKHGGGYRCSRVDVHQFQIKDVGFAPLAFTKVKAGYVCSECFYELYPDEKKNRSARREQLFLAELQRQLPELWTFLVNWDCPVGSVACSSKYKPDMLWDMVLWYFHVEFDETYSHEDCRDRIRAVCEDLADRPGLVLRVCGSGLFHRYTNPSTGRRTWAATDKFNGMMKRVYEWIKDNVVSFLGENVGMENPNVGTPGNPRVVKIF